MSTWEYKLISSGPLGFASMQLLEQHLGQLGKEEWEIINFTIKPDNPLVFNGLARRPIARDWFPPAAAKPAYTPPPIPSEEEEDDRDERSFADELPPSRPANAPAPADLGLGSFDDLGGSEEDLPTLFDALQPFLRKNPRGDLSVELDFLAKKFEQDARELLTAFEECGLKAPAPGAEKGDVVDHDGALYWLERDKRGRVWLNTRTKKFKTARTTPVPAEAADVAAPESEPAAGDQRETSRRTAAPPRPGRESRPERSQPARPAESIPADTGSFLGRIRSMMRRNRRGHGWSGSFQYLTKALKLDDAQLLEKLGEQGLRLEGGDQPVRAEDGGFDFWLNKNHRGEIWINADEKTEARGRRPEERGQRAEDPSSPGSDAASGGPGGGRDAGSAETGSFAKPPEDRAGSPEQAVGEVKRDTAEGRPQREYVDPRTPETAARALPPENTLTAVRLLMEPKKRGEGVTALVADLAQKLEKSDDQLMHALADAGLQLPESPKAKPTFARHGGEIFWLNANAKGQVWLNAKAAKKSPGKKPAE